MQYTKDETGKAIYAEPIYSYIPEDVGIVSECLATSGAFWPADLAIAEFVFPSHVICNTMSAAGTLLCIS